MLTGQPIQSDVELAAGEQLSDEGQPDRVDGALVVTLPQRERNPRCAAHHWADASRAAQGEPRVVFDMSKIDTLDRLAVASMVRCIRRCQSRGMAVALCHVSNEALAVMELNGVPHLATVSDTPITAARLLAREGVQ